MIDANTFRLDGRMALVTGSSTGIGFALAQGLAQAGASVIINGRDPARLMAAQARLAGLGLKVRSWVFDVADAHAVNDAVSTIETDIAPIDILINNAGITRRGVFQDIDVADWNAVLNTNLHAVFLVGQAVAKRMVPRGTGRIINICSVMSDVTRRGTASYTTSKGAVKMLTKSMAVDLAPHGITVNGIAPGYFETEMTASIATDPKLSAWIKERTPVGRWGALEDLAPAAVFLASDASRYVTGHVLTVDGGMTATL